MSHQIETFAPGVAAFASHRVHAWHRLGTVVDHAMSAEEALSIAHLDNWNVRKRPLTTTTETGEPVKVPGSFAVVRDNPFNHTTNVLGTVGNRYTPIQNEEHTDLLNALLHESQGEFETAGSLRGGREVFVTTKIPNTFNVGGVDPVDLYILAMNSHDGSTPFRFAVTPVRVMCANTMAAALRGARSVFTIRHTRGYRANIEAARQALGLTLNYADEFAIEAERMINETMTTDEFNAIVSQLYPAPAAGAADITIRRDRERRESLLNLFEASPTATQIAGTRWAGYQAITEYTDHVAPTQLNHWVNGETDARALRAVSPAITKLKANAFDLINH
jgi:phage/plasmid-like protein (TIGR03299 family)